MKQKRWKTEPGWLFETVSYVHKCPDGRRFNFETQRWRTFVIWLSNHGMGWLFDVPGIALVFALIVIWHWWKN